MRRARSFVPAFFFSLKNQKELNLKIEIIKNISSGAARYTVLDNVATERSYFI